MRISIVLLTYMKVLGMLGGETQSMFREPWVLSTMVCAVRLHTVVVVHKSED